jgi:hypothetical protein
MNNKSVFIFGGAAFALYLVYNRRDKLMDKENEDFREGFTAGFLTPGPFTVLAVAGLIHYS